MARKLDMNRVMAAADRRDFRFFNALTEEERKEFIYSIVLRWVHTIRGSRDQADAYLTTINERLNMHQDLMWSNPDLAYAMLASCGTGQIKSHIYSKARGRPKQNTILTEFWSIYYPGINDDEAHILSDQIDKKRFTELVKGSNLTPEQEKKIMAAYGQHQNNA